MRTAFFGALAVATSLALGGCAGGDDHEVGGSHTGQPCPIRHPGEQIS